MRNCHRKMLMVQVNNCWGQSEGITIIARDPNSSSEFCSSRSLMNDVIVWSSMSEYTDVSNNSVLRSHPCVKVS